jgi:hypothetical protein
VTEAERTFGKDAIFSQTFQVIGHSAFGNEAEIDFAPVYPDYNLYSVLLLNERITVTDADVDWSSALTVYSIFAPDQDSSLFQFGIESYGITEGPNDLGSIYGIYGSTVHGGSGSVDVISGLYFAAYHDGGGHVGSVVGMYIESGVNNGTATKATGIEVLSLGGVGVTDHIGLKIYNFSGASSSNKAIETNAGDVIFNESSDNNMKFRVEGATDQNLLVTDGPNNAVAIGAATRADSAKLYVAGKISTSDEMEINGALNHDGSTIGLNGNTPVAKGTITGSRGGNAALASLLAFLASRGDITDSSTA